jgi:hypothetical protein|tara:strand:+ start:3217 stop:3564 length:348 start_codon:yes stop_codon:yes gene_type:complete
MAISYTWDVNKCETYPSKNGKSNVVHAVHWRLKASDDANNDADGNPQVAEVYGVVDLDISDLSSFTNWSSLNASTVQGWVESALGADEVTALKAGLDAQIAEKISPSSVLKILGS